MKLTENELNYILSECIQQMILENEIDEEIINEDDPNINTNIKGKNINGGIGWGIGNKLQTTGKAIVDGFKNGQGFPGAKIIGGIKGALSQVPGASGIAMGNIIGKALPNFGWLLTKFGWGMIAMSIKKYVQLAAKGVPLNKYQAFQLALKSVTEYQNCSNLCQTIQKNFNNTCDAYTQVANELGWTKTDISWDDIKGNLTDVNFTLTQGSLKGVQGTTRINQDFSKQDVNEAVETPNFQEEVNLNTIIKFLKNFNENEAQKAVEQVGQLYVNAYQMYFKWKAYLRAIMQRHNIKWEEIKNGKLENGSLGAMFSTTNKSIDKDALSDKENNVPLTFIDITSLTNRNGNKIDYAILRTNNNVCYGVYWSDIEGSNIETILNSANTTTPCLQLNMQNGVFSQEKINYKGKRIPILSDMGVQSLSAIPTT